MDSPVPSKPLNKKTLAERMADDLREAIVAGEWAPGEALPTEPELGERFEVSKSVVRDAVRILMAWGLVTVQHGRGAFVTQDQGRAIEDGLLLALRRDGASVWDVEEFETLLHPEAAVLVARNASDAQLEDLRTALRAYVDAMKQDPEHPVILGPYRAFMMEFFAATGNAVLKRLGPALLSLRNVREWEGPDDLSPEEIAETEGDYFGQILDAIETRDEGTVRETVRRVMQLPPEAVQVMRTTPVGEAASIPIDLTDYLRHEKAT